MSRSVKLGIIINVTLLNSFFPIRLPNISLSDDIGVVPLVVFGKKFKCLYESSVDVFNLDLERGTFCHLGYVVAQGLDTLRLCC